MSDIQGPGWYHGEGDPAGTKRYWDGSQWIGEPQAMTEAPAATGGAAMSGSGRTPASFGTKAGAWLIDVGLLLALIFTLAVVALVLFAISEIVGLLALLLTFVVWIAAAVYLFGWVQGVTGQTPGKRIMGIETIRKDTGAYIGGGLGIGRWLISGAINQFCYISYIWAIFDEENETLTDKILTTQVVEGKKGGILPLFPDGKPF